MVVETVRACDWELRQIQGTLFEEATEEKVVLLYTSPSFKTFLEICIEQELPIPTEEEYHATWEEVTRGFKARNSFEFIQDREKVHSVLQGRLEKLRSQITSERREEIINNLQGVEDELKTFKKKNPCLPEAFFYQLKVSEVLKNQFLKQRSVE